MKRVKATIEVLVDVEDWVGSIKEDAWDYDQKKMTKKEVLAELKEDLQDREILMNNIDEFKVIEVKETKQEKFKW